MVNGKGKEEQSVWNLEPTHWETLTLRASATTDALEDGASVRVEPNPDTGAAELTFYATPLNKPLGFPYQFLEAIPGISLRGAQVGRAWLERETGFVHFEVALYAAAQALAADYESGASDLDFVTYEQAVEQAVRGTPADMAWLISEFRRLVNVANL